MQRAIGTIETGAEATPIATRSRLDAVLNVAIVLVAVFGIVTSVLPVFGNRLYAGSATHDFGTVRAGQTVEHQFRVRNLHPWPVTVTGVAGDCGCTETFVGHTTPFQLAPLEVVEVRASLDTSDKQGRVQQTIFVATRDNPQGTPLILQGEAR